MKTGLFGVLVPLTGIELMTFALRIGRPLAKSKGYLTDKHLFGTILGQCLPGNNLMATFTKRGDLQWQAKIRRKGYPDQSKTFSTRADAEKWARSVELEMDRGRFVSSSEAERTTFRDPRRDFYPLLDADPLDYSAA
ncbi:MAG: hypothetical protein ACLFVM_06700 [Ralstonia sp.]|jgi:hypothetical protein